MDNKEERYASLQEGHASLDRERVCRICGHKGTILCDGGHETCDSEECGKSFKD